MHLKISYLVLNYLRDCPYVNMDQILEFLERHDIARSDRSIYRLFKKLKEEYGVEVIWDVPRSGYYLPEEEETTVLKFLKLLEHFVTADLFTTNFSDNARLLDVVEYEYDREFVQLEVFKELLMAIEHRFEVCFEHFSYYSLHTKAFCVQPLYFKQYQNRWYLIADDHGAFKSFGLDRISKIQMTETSFKPRLEEAKELYAGVVGLNHSDSERQRIVLEFNISQKPYLESLPMHTTQQEIKTDNPNTYTIELFIAPNYEFQQQVQKYGNLVRVVEGEVSVSYRFLG